MKRINFFLALVLIGAASFGIGCHKQNSEIENLSVANKVEDDSATNKNVPIEHLQQTATWLANYYRQYAESLTGGTAAPPYPIGGDWFITRISESGDQIFVNVLLPDAAGALARANPTEWKWKVRQIVAPNKFEQIWQMLRASDEIVFRVSDAKGKILESECNKPID